MFKPSRRTFLRTASALPLFAISTSRARAAAATLKVATVLTTDLNNSGAAMWFEPFREAVQKNTGGDVAVQFFPNGQLGTEAAVLTQVKLGLVDISVGGSSIWSTVVPEVGMFDMGYLFQDWDQARQALDGLAGQTMTRLLAQRAQVHVFGWGFSPGIRNVLAKSAVHNPAEMEGKKIRVLPVPYFVQTFKLMGAVPTPMAFGEVYTALQAGVIDGMEHDAPTILAGKYSEAAKQYVQTRHILNPFNPLISERSLARLSPKLRDGVVAAGEEAVKQQRVLASQAEEKAMTALQSERVAVVDCDRAAFRKAVTPLWHEYGTKYPEMQPVLQSILALHT